MFFALMSRSFCAAALGIALAACAHNVVSLPATMTAASPTTLLLEQSVSLTLQTGYKRLLPQDSRWRRVGELPQGSVYQNVGSVFTIEGRNVHEAYLVISPQQQLVGFFLPGEARFSSLPSPVPLILKELP